MINKIRKFQYLSDTYEYYKHGVYLILDYKPNWVMLVTPKMYYDNTGKSFKHLYADHFSIPYNKDSKKRQIQFHSTKYIPSANTTYNPDGASGIRTHIDNHFKNNIELPLHGDTSVILDKFLPIERLSVLDFLRYPQLQPGGGKRKSLAVPKEPPKNQK